MYDRQPTPGKEGRVLITPLNGSTPFYATVAMADEPLEKGTALNKATLLKDATAALLGLGADAVPDDVYKQIYNRLLAKTEMEIVSYTGTGTYGADNPNSITFSRAPQLIIMIGVRIGTGNHMWDQLGANEDDWIYMLPTDALSTEYEERIGLGNNANGTVYGKKSADGKTISWYNGDYASWQYNSASNTTYYVLALFDGGHSGTEDAGTAGNSGSGDSGSTNATVVTFTVDGGVNRTVEAGTTWEEYITGLGDGTKLFVDGQYVFYGTADSPVALRDPTGNEVMASDIIVSGDYSAE